MGSWKLDELPIIIAGLTGLAVVPFLLCAWQVRRAPTARRSADVKLAIALLPSLAGLMLALVLAVLVLVGG